MLFDTSIRSETGHSVGSLVTAALMSCSSGRPALVGLDALAAQLVDPTLATWRLEALRAHQAFWDARIAREEALVAASASRTLGVAHPNLFDQRAERERAREMAAHEDETASTRTHIDRLRQLAAIDGVYRTTVLVLLP